MTSNLDIFQSQGYLVTAPLLAAKELDDVEIHLQKIPVSVTGDRGVLEQNWCKSLALRLGSHPALASLLPRDGSAVQCTFFQKSSESNWLVPMHQDLSIPVAKRVNHPKLSTWSQKNGLVYVQAPEELLNKLVAIRLHLDECGENDGPLRVIPASHHAGKLDHASIQRMQQEKNEVSCAAKAGSVMVMKPLLLHASSKATGNSKRRLLHFLYAPATLPYGLRWPYV